MSARSEHRGRLAGVDVFAGHAATIARKHGVTRSAVYQARHAAVAEKPRTLNDADLTRPTAELRAEYGVTTSGVCAARKRLGIPAPPKTGRPKGTRPIVAPRVMQSRQPVVKAPTFEERDLVAAVDGELAICPAPFVAALVVSKRLRLPMERVLAVAERRCGMAAK